MSLTFGFELKTVWPLLKPQLDKKLASAPPATVGKELAGVVRQEYSAPADRARMAQILLAAAQELGG
jgi:hypothetical protein